MTKWETPKRRAGGIFKKGNPICQECGDRFIPVNSNNFYCQPCKEIRKKKRSLFSKPGFYR